MKLLIGGFGEPKNEYAREKYSCNYIYDNLHMYIKEQCLLSKTKEDIFKELDIIILENPDMVFICDEIGNGVVPMEKEDRYWRETTGRVLTYLASKADSVERMVCGIAVKIK